MLIKTITILLIYFCSFSLRSEPWVDTRDSWLRADIEMLADAGIITVPITTYPLMWSGIIKDLDNSDIRNIEAKYKSVFWRVKKTARSALRTKQNKELRVSVSNAEQVFRSFGDEARGETELAARSYNMNKNFAWNMEITRVNLFQSQAPKDNDSTRYDGSYISAILGNWVVTAGKVEKWWGPGWQTNNLLSNNARPPLGLSLQRNYSNPIDNTILKWLGPLSVSSFIGELDDKRVISSAKTGGLSLTFKPHQSLEIGLRATTMFGGKTRSESANALINSLIANQTCESADVVVCDDFYSTKGSRLGGVDMRWRLPFISATSLYASAYGESETQLLPDKTMQQLGITSSFSILNANWKWFLESSDTSLNGLKNTAYESTIYQTGYRYNGRALGSTLDNDSQSNTFGVIASLNKVNQFKLTFADIKLNLDSETNPESENHSITNNTQNIKQFKLTWLYKNKHSGDIKFSFEHYDYVFDEQLRLDDKNRYTLEWIYRFGR